jgi:hypothetical protein
MEPSLANKILTGLALTQAQAHETAVVNGHWANRRTNAEAISALHKEVAKAVEIDIVGDGPSLTLQNFTRLEEKLADLVIRTLDIAGGNNLHVAAAVLAKMQQNENLANLVKKDW